MLLFEEGPRQGGKDKRHKMKQGCLDSTRPINYIAVRIPQCTYVLYYVQLCIVICLKNLSFCFLVAFASLY
jgi:hypothetical protein